ncbi:LysR family transcriptional regulator [Agrilactobacillus fermenti]|uniref:LysR family transcriptional regulator n=1 Tax=Agrilactobacillus fermenti TaxID=2586909 RepID=UPI001E550D74|nr:LysR family transcriptional regulator [Agrilactobacillus fermenti]MCD2255628.1 LysR family transcriptional regulator [Agrilactobacillus fermenti]
MELRVLGYLLAVAQEQTISGAAKILHLSQPTLSRQLRDLESELHTKLFIRGNRHITLTQAGTYLVEQSQQILDLVAKTTANLGTDQMITGDLTIGADETSGMLTLAKAFKELTQHYPKIKLHLYSADADTVLQRIDNGLIDFGLIIGPIVKDRYNFIDLPSKDSWGILMKKDDVLANHSAITPSMLKQRPLIISGQSTVNSQFGTWFGQNVAELNIVATYNLLYNAALLVQQDIGYALCLADIYQTQGTPLTFKRLHPNLTANLSLIWKQGLTLSPAAQAFLAILQAQLGQA